MTGLKDIKPVATLGAEQLYSEEQMQEYAISFVAFALKEGEPIDLVTSEDYQKYAEELFKKFKEKKMKKFEEVKRPAIGIEQSSIKPSLGKVTEFYTDKVKEYHNAFNEMNKYIDGLEAQLDYYKKDKRFEVMAEEILSLKSQLEKQQPEIPEVPQFVAEYIERCKSSDCGLIWAIRPDRDANDNSEEVYDWLYPNGVRLSDGTFPEPFEPDNLVRPDKENHIKFAHAWLNGYTVAKDKRFYLKHELTGQFLAKRNQESDYRKYFFWTGENPLTHSIGTAWELKFTQQEIDSMETGSYEQIPAEEEV